MSLMWTTSSRAPRLIAARRMLRPMRPKPLIAMRAMKPPLGLGGYIGRGSRSVKRTACANPLAEPVRVLEGRGAGLVEQRDDVEAGAPEAVHREDALPARRIGRDAGGDLQRVALARMRV